MELKKIIPNEVTQISKDKHYTFSLISGAAVCAAVHRVRCLWNEERLPGEGDWSVVLGADGKLEE